MARIRTVKPEFFRHEELQDLQIKYPDLYPMIVFPALWGHCDKHGVFEWKPRQLQLDIIPFIWEASVKKLVDSMMLLVEHNFIKTYQHDGKVYGHIPTFIDHQRINGKEAQAPSPLPELSEMIEYVIGEAVGKHRGSTREATETTGREGKGREEEEKTCSEQPSCSEPAFSFLLKDGSQYEISEDQADQWRRLYMCDVDAEMGKMIEWCRVNPKKRKTRDGALRFVCNWLSKQDTHCRETGEAEGLGMFEQELRRLEIINGR